MVNGSDPREPLRKAVDEVEKQIAATPGAQRATNGWNMWQKRESERIKKGGELANCTGLELRHKLVYDHSLKLVVRDAWGACDANMKEFTRVDGQR